MRTILFTAILTILLPIPSPATTNAQSLRQITQEDVEKVDSLLKKMTPAEKLGQMFMIGFDGQEVTEEVDTLIKRHHIGGFILFESNIKRMRSFKVEYDDRGIPENVVELTNSLQDAVVSLSNDATVRLPLFIAVDQENGSQLRIEKGVTLLPGNIALGQTRNAELAFQAGRITAAELRAMGIYMNLAPVVDVNVNDKNDIIGDRSFGGHQDIVTPLGVAFMQGLHSEGVIAVGKHLPGHGDSDVNPHDSLPIVVRPKSRLDEINIPPFEALVDHGVHALMTAHMFFEHLTNKSETTPVTLDKYVLDILRQRLGFDGVIMADDIWMGAITNWIKKTAKDTFEIKKDAIKKAIEAGNDMIVIAHFSKLDSTDSARLAQFDRIFNELEELYPDYSAQIDSSVRRILLLKTRVKSSLDATRWKVNKGQISSLLRTDENREIAEQIADSSIVLLSEKGKLVGKLAKTTYFSGENYPLKDFGASDTILVVSPVYRPPDDLTSKMEERYGNRIKPVRLLYGYYKPDAKRWAEGQWNKHLADSSIIDGDDTLKAIQEIIDGAEGAKAIVFGLRKRPHARILEHIVDSIKLKPKHKHKPIFVVASREPYFLPEKALTAKNVVSLVSGCNLEPSVESVVRVLCGDVKPKTCQYLSVSVRKDKWIDRTVEIGAKVVPRRAPHLVVSLAPEEGGGPRFPAVRVIVKNTGGVVSFPCSLLLLTTEFTEGSRKRLPRNVEYLDSIQPQGSHEFTFNPESGADTGAGSIAVTAQFDSPFHSGVMYAWNKDSITLRTKVQRKLERVPVKWTAFILCYLAGVIGAMVSVVLQTAPENKNVDLRRKQGRWRVSGIVLAQATFGILLYLCLIVVRNSGIPTPPIRDLLVDSLILYFISGFVGGFLGKSVLKIVPYFRKAV